MKPWISLCLNTKQTFKITGAQLNKMCNKGIHFKDFNVTVLHVFTVRHKEEEHIGRLTQSHCVDLNTWKHPRA